MSALPFNLLKLQIRFKFLFALYSLTSMDRRFLRACRRYVIKLNNKINMLSDSSDCILQTSISSMDIAIRDKAARLTMGEKLGEDVELDPGHVCFLASEIYDTGGHTELILRMLGLFQDFETYFIEANSGGRSKTLAPCKTERIKQLAHSQTLGTTKDFRKSISSLYNALLATRAKNIFVLIHPDDVVSTAALGLLKQRTAAHVIFIPHADHYLNLGLEFADVILGGRSVTRARLPRYADKFVHCPNIPDFSGNFSFAQAEIEAERARLGLTENDYVTLTGCPAHKIFNDPTFEYWHLLKRLLCAEPRLKHLFISKIKTEDFTLLAEFFRDAPAAWQRIIFLKPGPHFKLYLALADVYIDSFPVGSSLTHLDVVAANKNTVIKINRKNPNLSFESCLYDGYEYAVSDTDQMYDKILYLLRSKEAQNEIKERVRCYYNKVYSPEVLKATYTSVMVR